MPAIALAILSAGILSSQATGGEPAKGVTIDQQPGKLVINLDSQPFAEYVFTNTSRPYCYPVYAPGQLLITRNWPMKDVPGESHDHPHHKGLWFAHGAVNGIDFWSEQPGAGKTVHQRFTSIKPGKSFGVIKSENQWVSDKGAIVCTDERTLRFGKTSKDGNARFIDFQITIHASHGPITLGDTKEGTMAVRIAESMRLAGGEGKGHIVNSRGLHDNETWGKRAEWCDYYGPVDGKVAGIAIFDHPQNPRHPTWWHVRDYGLFAANPFGQHDFEKLKDVSAGNLTVTKGSSITFKYRFLFHEGDDSQGRVAQEWSEFAK